MDKLKFALLSIVVLFLLGLVGYWAIATIQSGTENATGQKMEQLQKENGNLAKEVKNLTSELSTLQAELEKLAPDAKGQSQPQINTPKSGIAQPTEYKYQELINELQKLIDGNFFIKLKSKGTSVGTIQKFLNIYNDTSDKVDNDYGAGTEKAVMVFQRDQGLSADGKAGLSTFSKMIEWLKKQG